MESGVGRTGLCLRVHPSHPSLTDHEFTWLIHFSSVLFLIKYLLFFFFFIFLVMMECTSILLNYKKRRKKIMVTPQEVSVCASSFIISGSKGVESEGKGYQFTSQWKLCGIK